MRVPAAMLALLLAAGCLDRPVTPPAAPGVPAPTPSAAEEAVAAPDPLAEVARLAASGDLVAARAAFDRAANAGPVTLDFPGRASVGAPLVDLRFTPAGDALGFVARNGAGFRLELATGTLDPYPAHQPAGELLGPFPLAGRAEGYEDSEIRGVALARDARPVVLLEEGANQIGPPGTPIGPHPPPTLAVATIQLAPGARPIRLPPVPRFSGGAAMFSGLVLSADGGIAAAFFGASESQYIHLWQLPSGRALAGGFGDFGNVSGMALDDRATHLAADAQGSLQVWELPTPGSRRKPRKLAELPGAAGAGMRFSPDGARLATPAYLNANEVTLIDVAGAKKLGTLAARAPLAFSADGRLLAVRSADGIAIHRVDDRTLVASGAGLSGEAVGLAFSPDGRLLAGVSRTGQAVLFDAATGKALLELRLGEGAAAAISPDGHVALLGNAASARKLVACRVRGFELPIEVCEQRVSEIGLVARALGLRR